MRLLLLLIFTACTHRFTPSTLQTRENNLSSLLIQSSHSVNPVEAHKLAKEALRYSHLLASRYRVNTPPLVHNFLVNIGIKKRGLCYQWSDDLYKQLQTLHLKTLQIKPIGANIGQYWTEHNALAVLPTEKSDLTHAVLLDPWRESGVLYFSPVRKDPSYAWQIRTDREAIYQNGR